MKRLQFVINLQFCLEDNFAKYAKAIGQNCIILCDRGLMDGSAYVTPKQWENVISKNQVPLITTTAIEDERTEKIKMVPLTTINDWDVRYDAVFHLVTAADGAPQYYTLENNLGARHETPEMAREQDMKTQIAWSDHPHHMIIDNKGKTFEQKIEALIDLISNYL